MKTRLHQLQSASESPLTQAVVQIIKAEESSESFISDVLTHGCISGVVTQLIYYTYTHQFYDTHYDEIEALREEYEAETGAPIHADGDHKNHMAWFAFELITYRISWELGL